MEVPSQQVQALVNRLASGPGCLSADQARALIARITNSAPADIPSHHREVCRRLPRGPSVPQVRLLTGLPPEEVCARLAELMDPSSPAQLPPDWLAELPPEQRSEYKQRGAVIQDTAERAATLAQFRSLGELVRAVLGLRELWDDHANERYDWKTINMYGICGEIVKPLTGRDRCSWVELVGRGPQLAVWFASHSWATPFWQTLKMLEWHSEVHGLPLESTWWFCTLANNQWDLGELGGSLESTPFWRALASASCRGLVQLMDEDCTPHSRIWCILEMYVVFEEQKEFEVLAINNCGFEWESCALRDAHGKEHTQLGFPFPREMATKGAQVKVQNAQASQDKDRRAILSTIAGGAGGEDEPPAEHPRYDEVNEKVRSLFRGAALCYYATEGDQEAVHELLAYGVEINYQDGTGFAPMHWAALEGDVEMVRMLTELGADMNLAADNGDTPMHRAAREGASWKLAEKPDSGRSCVAT